MKCDICQAEEAQSFSVDGQIFCLCPVCQETHKRMPIEFLKGVVG